MSLSEKAYYETLVNYKKDLEKENSSDSGIGNAVRTPNELKAEQENRIRSYYKGLASQAMFADTIDEAVSALGGESFSNLEIMRVINSQGTGSYGNRAFETFKNDYTKAYIKDKMASLRKTMGNQSEALIRKQAESELRDEAVKAFAKVNYQFFYPILLGLRADEIIGKSYNDQIYDIDRLREKYGANFEGLNDILPQEALGTHKLYSVDVREDNGVITHKIVLDVNDSNGFDKGDKVLESWTGNDRGGATGSQTTLTWEKDGSIKVQAQSGGASNYK
jgi:hypothetical protein